MYWYWYNFFNSYISYTKQILCCNNNLKKYDKNYK